MCKSFNELSEDEKQKVIDDHRNINTDSDWYVFTLEDWEEKLERQGFNSPKIYFSGFYSQGDGASFTATVNLEQFLKGRRIATKYAKELKTWQENGDSIVINQSGYYSHEMTMSIDSDNLSAGLEAFILEEAREQARKIYKELKADYEDLTSDETIAETLRANDYYFNAETLRIETV